MLDLIRILSLIQSYQDKEGRVCTPCKNILTRLDQAEAQASVTGEGGAVGGAGEKLHLFFNKQ